MSYKSQDLKNFEVNKTVYSQSVNISDIDFNFISDKIKAKLNIESSHIYKIAFLGNENSLKLSANFNSIVVIVKEINSRYLQKVFNYNKGIFTENKKLSKTKKGYSLGYFGYLSFLTNNQSVLVISHPNTESLYNSKEKVSNIDEIVAEEFPKIITSKNYISGGHSCDENQCPSGRGWCKFGERDMECGQSDYLEDTICMRREMAPKISSDSKYDNAMYFVRDVLLKKSTIGQERIDYYYKLGYIFKSHGLLTENESDFSEIMSFVQKKSFQYFTSNSSDVILNNNDLTFINKIIDKLEPKVKNLEYKEIFKKLRSDVKTLTNKKVVDINEYFK